MQHFAPDSLRLNKFQHVELPDNSQLYLRTIGKSLPTASPDVERADFFSRKTEQLHNIEQQLYNDYAAYANEQEQQQQQQQQQQQDQE